MHAEVIAHTLAEERAGSHDSESDPETVHDTTQDRYYLVAKQWWERDDDEDGYRDEPTRGNISDAFREGSQFLHWYRCKP